MMRVIIAGARNQKPTEKIFLLLCQALKEEAEGGPIFGRRVSTELTTVVLLVTESPVLLYSRFVCNAFLPQRGSNYPEGQPSPLGWSVTSGW